MIFYAQLGGSGDSSSRLYAQVSRSREGIRVRVGEMAGAAFIEGADVMIHEHDPRVAQVHDGHGWNLAALAALLQSLPLRTHSESPLATTKQWIARELQRTLQAPPREGRMAYLEGLITAAGALRAQEALPYLIHIAHSRKLPTALRKRANAARWQIGEAYAFETALPSGGRLRLAGRVSVEVSG